MQHNNASQLWRIYSHLHTQFGRPQRESNPRPPDYHSATTPRLQNARSGNETCGLLVVSLAFYTPTPPPLSQEKELLATANFTDSPKRLLFDSCQLRQKVTSQPAHSPLSPKTRPEISRDVNTHRGCGATWECRCHAVQTSPHALVLTRPTQKFPHSHGTCPLDSRCLRNGDLLTRTSGATAGRDDQRPGKQRRLDQGEKNTVFLSFNSCAMTPLGNRLTFISLDPCIVFANLESYQQEPSNGESFWPCSGQKSETK